MAYDRQKFDLDLPLEAPLDEVKFTPDLVGLIAWLEAQHRDEEYNAGNYHTCLFGQFHTAINREHIVSVMGELERLYPGATYISYRYPHTFGAALNRAYRQQYGFFGAIFHRARSHTTGTK